MQDKKSHKFSDLRKKIKERLSRESDELKTKSQEDIQSLIQELQMYQTQLEKRHEELRWIQQELEKSERKYRHIVENAPSGIYEIDFEEMRFLSANEAALKITGHTEEEMASMNPMSILTSDSRRRFLKRLAEMKKGAAPPEEVEFEVRKKDGGTTWVLLNVQFHRKNGMIGRATVVVHDINDRKAMESRLRESENLFRTLAENAPDIIIRYDKELRHIYVSPAIETFTKIPREKYIGKTNEQLGMPATLCEKWNTFLKDIFSSGRAGTLEFEFKEPDGTYTFEMHAIPEFSEKGELTTIIAISRNITEHKDALADRTRLLEELNVERARLQAIISCAPQGIVVTDDKARIIMTNSVADELYGRTIPYDKPYDSHKALQLFDEEGDDISSRNLPLTRSALHGEHHLNKELMIVKPNGERRYLLVNSSPIKNLRSRVTGAVGVFQDITERKLEYEKKSQDEAQRYARNIVETVQSPMLILDPDLRVVMVNRAYYSTFKSKKKDTIGKYFHELGDRQWDIPELNELLERILPEKKIVRNYIIDHHFEKIGRCIMSINARQLRGTEQDEGRMLIFIRDITEQKLAEQEHLEYQKKLRALTAQLTDSEDKERKRIAAGLHDSVVQSLTATRMKLSVAREDTAAEKTDHKLKELDDSIGKVIEEIRSLSFDLSSPMLHTIGLEQTIEWLAEKFSEERKIPVNFKDDEAKKPLTENIRNILFQAIRELLNNVVKHAEANQVTISIKKVDENIHIEIRDNGVGFDTTDLFSVIGKSKGFGLFNIRERLEYVDGSITLNSKPGKGTKIVLKAPLRPENAE